MNAMIHLLITILCIPSAALANCATRVLTDKLTDPSGQEVMSSKEQVSCAEGSSSLDALVGLDADCNVYEIHGFLQTACRYPNGRWEVISDIEAFDSVTGQVSSQSGRQSVAPPVMNSYGSSLLNGLLAALKSGGGSLDDGARQLHERALVLTLERAGNGEIVAWNHPESGQSGRLKPVLTRSVNGGICRKLLVELHLRGETGQFTETACRGRGSQSWHYLDSE